MDPIAVAHQNLTRRQLLSHALVERRFSNY